MPPPSLATDDAMDVLLILTYALSRSLMAPPCTTTTTSHRVAGHGWPARLRDGGLVGWVAHGPGMHRGSGRGSARPWQHMPT